MNHQGYHVQHFTNKNTRRYIDVLQDIASKYSASYHRNIKMAPKNVHRDKETQVWINLYKKRLPCKQRKRSKFSVGDFVRLSIKKTSLMKRYQEIWIEEVFIVDSIVYGNPTTYKMKDQDNEPMQGTFYEQEL